LGKGYRLKSRKTYYLDGWRRFFMGSDYDEWDQIYRKYQLESLGWELGKPRPILVEFVERGLIKNGKALDLCCGAGTNTIYLAEKGFDVTGIDVSQRAIQYARAKAQHTKAQINFVRQSFVELAFGDEEFDFVFDMGCFHHVEIADRHKFIEGVHRVLKEGGDYMLTCFGYKNGSAWNHFTEKQLVSLFSGYFEIKEIRHVSSIEGEGVKRFFYTVWMKKKK
jgi:2-polyprenyl-3-methyl-5-hydroxy-6-metoxy-1,4-benzoquinol methylase